MNDFKVNLSHKKESEQARESTIQIYHRAQGETFYEYKISAKGGHYAKDHGQNQ